MLGGLVVEGTIEMKMVSTGEFFLKDDGQKSLANNRNWYGKRIFQVAGEVARVKIRINQRADSTQVEY